MVKRPNRSDREGNRANLASRIHSGWAARAVLTGWLSGTVVFLVVALVRGLACLWLVTCNGRATDASLESLVEDLAVRLKLARKPRLLITNSRVGPAVVGVFRPLVLLPAVVVRGKSRAQLEPIIAHELIHVRRGDLWVGMLQVLAQGLCWFHPLV